MSETITKRLYIGGLSSSVTEDEISERFSRFGKVSDLSLKSRHDDEGICIKVFAHLNIEGNEENIKKCFNTYQNTKWKGSVLKLQYAKESFLTRLEKERESEVDNMKKDLPEEVKTSGGEWKPPQFTKLNGPAVPGTPIPGKKDWIVGKYGRVLPILNVKKSYKLKAIKHDPSKFCHAARIFKDENTDNTSTSATCDNLTWEIAKPDSEITKKRKGEFPPSSPSKKSKKSTVIKPKDYFTSDTFTSIGQSNESTFDDFEVVKIGQKKKSVESALVPSRFDSDYEDDDMDSGKINMSVNNFDSSKSPKKLLLTSNKRIQNSQAKSELSVNTKLNELSENDKKHNSLKAKGDMSKDTKLTNASTNQKTIATPTSDFSNNKRRKVPEFAGLGMLTGTTSNRTSQSQENKTVGDVTPHDKMTEKKQEPQALKKEGKSKTDSSPKSKERENNDSILSSKRSTSVKGPLSPKGPSLKEIKGPITQASVNECAKNNRNLSTPKSKKVIKKLELEHKSPPSGKNKSDSKTLMATNKKSVLREEDGSDTTSSADTDEIIARCKIKQKSDSPATNRKDSPVLNDYVRNENMDLSEFSASAPEVLSNPFGTPSHAFSSIASDSYDSDLDSNDFELVAKKLALKASSSQSVLIDSFKENTAVAETLKEPVKKPTLKVEKSDIISNTKKPTDVKVKASLPPEKSLQSKLLDIANSRHKPSEKKTSSEKTSKERKNKHVADNEKRLQALDEQKKIKEQQKQIVKAALENVDSACTKRIVFSSSDEEDSAEGNKQSVKPSQEVSVKGTKGQDDSKKSSAKLTLLDSSSSDESDYEEMFKSKPQFEGKKGEKLMEMQRKIGDSRFQMDEKFMDSGDSDDEEDEKAEKDTEVQDSLQDEKKMNLEVLENVVGKSKMDHFTAKMKKKTKHIIDMNAVRFDPTKLKPQKPEPDPKEEASDVEEEVEMEVEPSSPQPVSKATKSEEKTKEEKSKKKVKEQSKSNVTMSSSLVNMLKSQAKEKDSGVAGDSSFSLLQQFDEDNENNESSDEDDKADKAITPLSHLLSPKEMENSMKAHEDENESSSDEDSDEEDDARSSDDDSDEEDNAQSSNEEDNAQNSGEDSDEQDNAQSSVEDSDEDNAQSSDEDSDEEDNAQSSDEDSDEEDNEQSSVEENIKQSSDTGFDKEDDTDKSETDSEINSNKGVSKEQTSQPNKLNKATHFNVDDSDRQEDDVDEKDDLISITTPYNPLDEKERALISAGRTDIRFTKKDWLERWDEIRTDLMKLCRRKHKDAGKRKRLLNEKKRKKMILKNVKRKPWLKH